MRYVGFYLLNSQRDAVSIAANAALPGMPCLNSPTLSANPEAIAWKSY